MNQKELNLIAKEYLPHYKLLMDYFHPYTIKGIFHSEMLMFITLIGELKPKQVIESGRANGQSTEIITRYYPNLEFHSIESSRNDAELAESRLKGLNVDLIYGDSFQMMPSLIQGKKTLILIDGPKGSGMWKLFQLMYSMPDVIGVAMHDSYDGTTQRMNLEKQYKGKYLISDNEDFVEAFKHIDDECWRVNPWGPYEMGSYRQGQVYDLHPCKSYSGTLSFVGK